MNLQAKYSTAECFPMVGSDTRIASAKIERISPFTGYDVEMVHTSQ